MNSIRNIINPSKINSVLIKKNKMYIINENPNLKTKSIKLRKKMISLISKALILERNKKTIIFRRFDNSKSVNQNIFPTKQTQVKSNQNAI